ncbi:HAD family hydrolase [uncultured Hymenobacter sp.]|uniref:HAD family hydrolase n=1 Tax=uncultured Hymenobacter sp. TaxID=170016 RepID=UPI0035CBF13D
MVVFPGVDWQKVKAVIFDVDGTLYAQDKLRGKLLTDLLAYYALRPWRLRELLLLRRFRAEREKRAGGHFAGLEQAQYAWCVGSDPVALAQLRRVVNHWMFQHPNQYLPACTYPGTTSFFNALRQRGIKIGIYSDYPAQAKLAAMHLSADAVVSSTDPEVDRLKPDPQGLRHVTQLLGLTPAECLFIGDRPELDGACAEQAGMPCLIVEKQAFQHFTFYQDLEQQLAAQPNSSVLYQAT